jgi:hypothetical protein
MGVAWLLRQLAFRQLVLNNLKLSPIREAIGCDPGAEQNHKASNAPEGVQFCGGERFFLSDCVEVCVRAFDRVEALPVLGYLSFPRSHVIFPSALSCEGVALARVYVHHRLQVGQFDFELRRVGRATDSESRNCISARAEAIAADGYDHDADERAKFVQVVRRERDRWHHASFYRIPLGQPISEVVQ